MRKKFQTRQMWELFAGLFSFPEENYNEYSQELLSLLADSRLKSARDIKAFNDWLSSTPPDELEETYTRTFDLSPTTTPIVGVYLFGQESYKRGELMARLVGRYQELGIKLNNELPDHVAHLLRYLAQVDKDEQQEIDCFLLRPSLVKMRKQLSDADNPFSHLATAALVQLEYEFGKEAVHA